MPNQHSPDKVCLSTWIPRTLHRRVAKAAEQKGMTQTDYVEHLYIQATRKTELTPHDYRRIAKETERARKKNPAQSLDSAGTRRKGRKTRPATASKPG